VEFLLTSVDSNRFEMVQIVSEDEHYAMKINDGPTLDQVLSAVWISDIQRTEIQK
jgi:hypothetical protein